MHIISRRSTTRRSVTSFFFYTKSNKYKWIAQFQNIQKPSLKDISSRKNRAVFHRPRFDADGQKIQSGNLAGEAQNLQKIGSGAVPKRDWKSYISWINSFEEEWHAQAGWAESLSGRNAGQARSAIWDDIERVANTSGERLGYPTQKPEALLERIIRPVVTRETLCSIHFVGVARPWPSRTAESALDRD